MLGIKAIASISDPRFDVVRLVTLWAVGRRPESNTKQRREAGRSHRTMVTLLVVQADQTERVDLQLIQVTHFGNHAIKLDKELSVPLSLSTTIECPALRR